MRKIYYLLFAISLSTFVNAQLRVAILGGANQSSIEETNNLPNWDNLKKGYAQRSGAHFGFQADLPFSVNSKLFFQPAVIFNNKGRKFSTANDTTVSNIKFFNSTQYINYIDIPLNLILKFKLSPKASFFLGGGPYLSFFYSGSEKTETFFKNGSFSSEENNDLPIGKGAGKYEVVNYGLNGTAGFEFGKVFISGKYAKGLNDFYQASSYTGSFKHQVISATLGVYIGKPVKLDSKIKDRDNDGVPDDLDMCPDEPGTALTKGCPDRDSDGIADKDDTCPDVAGLVKNNGCPDVKDSDGDGVPDSEDKCPNIVGLKKYAGCPIPDTDGDGVNDEDDKCPTIAGLGRYGGCPIPDTDGDGINDEEDKCPNIAGKKENNGCPDAVIKKEIIEKVNWAASKIQFKTGSTQIEKSGFSKLDEVADILKKYPELKLSIEGHTSSDGNYQANIKLSLDRANSVKNYLLLKGISVERLKTSGFGPDKPLTKENTPEANLANRRVELKLSN